ncbi:MAG: (d)CMP kinase [Acidobacteriales bacterium]|nr:(d)CMP kinase [Terriglobales bacterium]
MSKPLVVAIDGPAGAGKSTIARRVASKLGFIYIDTGAMYRAVALWAIRAGVDLDDTLKLEQLARAAQIGFQAGANGITLNGEDVSEAIRAPEMGDAASRVSTFAGVRRALVEKQRAVAASTSVVMEGRDIGTVVFPDAGIKIFLDARPGERATRRTRELQEKGLEADPREIALQIAERDTRDRTRKEAPLLQAPDALYLDSTELSLDEVEERVLKLIRDRTSNGKDHAR